MSPAAQPHTEEPRRRRYLVHLFALLEDGTDNRRYVARIRPWAGRTSKMETQERIFADDCELIATINPLLPRGSDVRDVFEHVDGPNGFFYLLHLTSEEAGQLSWRP